MEQTPLPLVRSPLLSQFPNLICGMSTRQGGDRDSLFGFNLGYGLGDDDGRVREHRRRFFNRLGIGENTIAFQAQVHESGITLIDEPGEYPANDALITRTAMVGLAVGTADCVPILVYAPGENAVAAIHAGWRGTLQEITAQTLERLRDECGASMRTTFASIGPAAAACCYEVSEEIADRFPPETVTRSVKGTPHLNLKKANWLQMRAAGIPAENIEINAHCTICKPSIFHSHRRDGQSAGRMLAVIAMKEAL